MARLTRTQKFAALREELANSSEESHVNEDLNKFQDKLNSLETAFNKETEAKKEDFNLNIEPIPSFEEVKQEATLEEVKPEEETKTSEELENNFLKDFDFENINKAIDEIVKQNVANLDNDQDINIDSTSVFNATHQFVNPGSEYVEENQTEASFEPVEEPVEDGFEPNKEGSKEETLEPVTDEESSIIEKTPDVEELVVEEEPKLDPNEIKQLIKDTISELFIDKKQEAEVKLDEVIDSFDALKNAVENQDNKEEPKEEPSVIEQASAVKEPVVEETVEEPKVDEPIVELVEETFVEEESKTEEKLEEEPVDINAVEEETTNDESILEDDGDDSVLNDFDLDLSDLSIPDFTEEAADIASIKFSDEESDAIEAKEAADIDSIKFSDEESEAIEAKEAAQDILVVEEITVEEQIDSNTVNEEVPVAEESTKNNEIPTDENTNQETVTIEENELVEEETSVEEEPEAELHYAEKDYNELANDLAKEVEELDGKVEPVKEELVEEDSNTVNEEAPVAEESAKNNEVPTDENTNQETATIEENELVEEEASVEEEPEEENPILSNSDISSLLDSALAEAMTYNSQAGRSTVEQISNDLIDEVRHGNLPESEDDDEFSNTVTLEIDKVLSEINLDTMSSLKIDDVLEDKKEVEPLEVKPEEVAEKLADTIAHPVLAKSLEEEPVEIKSMEETFTNNVTTSTIAFDNKKLEKEDASEEDYYYDDDKPNKILNVILVILMVMLVAIIGVIVYYILYAKGVIG